jgi:hypothetical protein
MRRYAVPAALAVVLSVAYGWAELVGFAWTDYESANVVPLRNLVGGHLAAFLHTAPIEGPSLLLRAPFALASWAWGASDMAIYRMVAVPGLLAGAVLAVVLCELSRRRGTAPGWALAFVVLAAGNPLTLRALDIGHPEELLGAALCVGAVLAALHQRPWLAGVLLGLALANKAWAVLAIAPVLLALEDHRWRTLLLAGGTGAAFVAPFVLFGGAGGGAVLSAAHTDVVFQPWQLWWPLGDHSHAVRGMLGDLKDGYRAAPAWLAPVTHPLIAVLGIPAALWWRRRRGTGAASADVLLLLAFLLLARCVLDAANNVYYHLPFVLALLAWEAVSRDRPPVLTAIATSLVWVTFQTAPPVLSPDAQWLLYMAWALPALALLARAAFRPATPKAPQERGLRGTAAELSLT